MSAYNEVVGIETEQCPRCQSIIQRPVQFKYGDSWQHQYSVGDRIKWGGNDIGEPGHLLVVVLGYPGECPVCGYVPDCTYDVWIKEDSIDSVQPSDGAYDYFSTGRTYFVVES